MLSLGEYSAYAPAVLSQQLPLFSNFRIPSRYTIPFLQFAVLTLAWAFQSREHRYPLTGRLRTALGIAFIVLTAHLLVTNQWHFKQVFTEPSFPTTFHWMAGPQRHRHRSTDECCTHRDRRCCARWSRIAPSSIVMSRCRSIARRIPIEPCCRYRDTARVSDMTFSPNRVAFNVFGGPEPAKLLLNYNWAPGWSSTAGPIELIGAPGKLATLTIPPGQTGRYEFSFTPPGLIAGTVIFAIAVLVSGLAWRKRTRPISLSRPQIDAD